MNMLKMEENAKYRQTIKNVLEFNPEILQRFVNFMNNPDEKTAVEQFGKEGKYFGAAVLLVTMPGLPMFGHGQIEGLTEKYGMEYRRAYWSEEIDRHWWKCTTADLPADESAFLRWCRELRSTTQAGDTVTKTSSREFLQNERAL
jgi:hypothetical protein